MIELVLARAPYAALFFPREELPSTESALTPLLERSPLEADFVVVMEPTDNELHAGCVGQHQRDMGVPRALRALRAALAGRQRHQPRRAGDRRAGQRPDPAGDVRRPHVLRGRVGHEGRRRHRHERDPGHLHRARQLPLRAGPHAGGGRGAAGRADRRPRRADDHRQLGLGRGRRRPPAGAQADPGRKRSPSRPSRRGRRSRSSPPPASRRSTSARARTAQAHQRDESIEIAALLRSFQVLEAFGT